jgi:hypothetical protein
LISNDKLMLTAKDWAENWKRVGPILEQLKAEELRKLDGKPVSEAIFQMCNWCCEREELRLTSGLVEQQRLFMKARGKN